MKKPAKPSRRKAKRPALFFDKLFNNYRKYRNHLRYVHTDLL